MNEKIKSIDNHIAIIKISRERGWISGTEARDFTVRLSRKRRKEMSKLLEIPVLSLPFGGDVNQKLSQ